MKVSEIVSIIEEQAPIVLQEDYDNCGLLTGRLEDDVSGVLVTLDITEEILDEAIATDCGLIISHHPVVLKSGLRSFTGKNASERIVIKAIKNNLCLYSAHTNLDMVPNGVSGKMCQKLGLINCKVLDARKNSLVKLVAFVPESHVDHVREAVFNAGAGHIGNYDSCSFSSLGQGSFHGNDLTTPFVGEKGEMHFENEVRFETILPDFIQNQVVAALIEAHPYEEVAYDLYSLNNKWEQAGLGMIGELEQEMSEMEFLHYLKEKFDLQVIRHTQLLKRPVKRVALCGGSGSFLLSKAKAKGADVFITGDFKYHQFFDAEKQILIADIGHYESEQYTKQLFFELLTKKLPNFAVRLSKVNSNPIKYL